MFFSGFLFISTCILLDMLSLGSAEAYTERNKKLNSHSMASCVGNIRTKSYQNLTIGFQVTVENVGDAFLGHSAVIINYKNHMKLNICWHHFYTNIQSSMIQETQQSVGKMSLSVFLLVPTKKDV